MNHYAHSDLTTEYRHHFIDPENVDEKRFSILKTLFPNSEGNLDTIQWNDLNNSLLPLYPTRELTGAKLRGVAQKAHQFVSADQRDYYPKTDHIVVDKYDDLPKNIRTTKVPKVAKSKATGELVILQGDNSNRKVKMPINGNKAMQVKGQQSLLKFITRSKDGQLSTDSTNKLTSPPGLLTNIRKWK